MTNTANSSWNWTVTNSQVRVSTWNWNLTTPSRRSHLELELISGSPPAPTGMVSVWTLAPASLRTDPYLSTIATLVSYSRRRLRTREHPAPARRPLRNTPPGYPQQP